MKEFRNNIISETEVRKHTPATSDYATLEREIYDAY
jgi:hypothetical protein